MAKVSALGQTNKGYSNVRTNQSKNYTVNDMVGLASAPITTASDYAAANNRNNTSYTPYTTALDYALAYGQDTSNQNLPAATVDPKTGLAPSTAPTTGSGSGGSGGGSGGSGGGSGSGSPSGSGSTAPHSDIPLEQAYIPGNDPAYQEALNALNNLTGATPTYTPSYDDQLSELYNRIIGRGPFQYDLNQDPFYQQYRTQAIDTGRLAMMDSMGQAAALTGGYGSSYGAQVGQQQYDAYLRALNEQVPEFYNSAYNRWLNEGNELESQYNLTRTMANDEYNKYQDQLSDYYRQLDLATDRENTLYNRGRTEAADAANARSDNRDRLLQLMTTTGYTPSEAELEAAGMSPDEAAAWQNYYLASITPSGGGGGGGGSGSGNVKLKFDQDQINSAISAYQSGGLNGLDSYEMQLMLQGVDPEAIDYLDSYIQGSFSPNTGSKGASTSQTRTQNNQATSTQNTTSGGLSSSSSGDEVLQYYRRMGWIK